jgi:putative endonuclease
MANPARPRGMLGEALAQLFLESRGHTILARNQRAGRREIDLVAERGATLIAIEVKWRRERAGEAPGAAAMAWRHAQRARAGEAVLCLMEHWPGGSERPWRFDLIAIEERANGWSLVHHPGAWSPADSCW